MDQTTITLCRYEHLQLSNWRNGTPDISAYDLQRRVEPILNKYNLKAKEGSFVLEAGSISQFCADIYISIRSSELYEISFRREEDWEIFIKELHNISETTGVAFLNENSGWMLGKLFWEHFSVLRLFLSWSVVSLSFISEGSSPLRIQPANLTDLLIGLSDCGPPIFDAEDLRGKLNEFG